MINLQKSLYKSFVIKLFSVPLASSLIHLVPMKGTETKGDQSNHHPARPCRDVLGRG